MRAFTTPLHLCTVILPIMMLAVGTISTAVNPGVSVAAVDGDPLHFLSSLHLDSKLKIKSNDLGFFKVTSQNNRHLGLDVNVDASLAAAKPDFVVLAVDPRANVVLSTLSRVDATALVEKDLSLAFTLNDFSALVDVQVFVLVVVAVQAGADVSAMFCSGAGAKTTVDPSVLLGFDSAVVVNVNVGVSHI